METLMLETGNGNRNHGRPDIGDWKWKK